MSKGLGCIDFFNVNFSLALSSAVSYPRFYTPSPTRVKSGVPHQTLLEKENGGQTCPNGNGVDRLGGEENDVDQHRNRGGRDVESTGGSVNHRPAPRNGFNCGYDVTSSVIYNRYSGGIPNPAAQNGSNSEGRRGHSHGLGSPGDGVLVRVALLLALSVHSILEGLGVGAKSTKAYNLLFAIGIHKVRRLQYIRGEFIVPRSTIICLLLLERNATLRHSVSKPFPTRVSKYYI